MNIKTLLRTGAAVDNLSYSYLGNRPGGVPLSAVSDASGNNTGVKNGASSYSYDANGNMLTDGNRGATLTYNYRNVGPAKFTENSSRWREDVQL